MTSMKIVQFSWHPTTLSIYIQNSSTPFLDLGRLISNELHSSSNDNQSV